MAIPNEGFKMTKTCSRCEETKAAAEFYWRKRDRCHVSVCKSCVKAASKQWRLDNLTPERKSEWNGYLRDRRARIKDAVFAAYGGYKCACCPETTKQFLSIDHIENDGASFRRENFPKKSQANGAGHWTYAWLVKNNFPAGFQVLCMNCNFGKRMNHGVCPHQEATCNDQAKAVGTSVPKWSGPSLRLVC